MNLDCKKQNISKLFFLYTALLNRHTAKCYRIKKYLVWSVATWKSVWAVEKSEVLCLCCWCWIALVCHKTLKSEKLPSQSSSIVLCWKAPSPLLLGPLTYKVWSFSPTFLSHHCLWYPIIINCWGKLALWLLGKSYFFIWLTFHRCRYS